MSDDSQKRRAALWWALTIVVALTFLIVASSDTVYDLTSPPGPLQILMRKSYSIVAFAILGFLLSTAQAVSNRPQPALGVAGVVGAYSLLIEIVQAIAGSHEGLAWNGVDVAFGAIGGLLGALVRAIALKR